MGQGFSDESKNDKPKKVSLASPPLRKWKAVENEEPDFFVCSHNILAPRYTRASKYPFCPKEFLSREYRKDKLLQHVQSFQPIDILCLQELQENMYDEIKEDPYFQSKYSSEYKQITKIEAWRKSKYQKDRKDMNEYELAMSKEKEGVGIFFNKEMFELVDAYKIELNRDPWKEINALQENTREEENKYAPEEVDDFLRNTCLSSHNVSLVLVLLHKRTQKMIVICTIHAYFAHQHWTCQTYQFENLINHHLNEIPEVKEDKIDGIILCGDFNAKRNSKSIEFIKTKNIKDFETLAPSDSRNCYSILNRSPIFKAKNFEFQESYPQELKPFTRGSKMVIDYLFRSGKIKPISVLTFEKEEYNKEEYPNKKIYSDHIMIGASYKFG